MRRALVVSIAWWLARGNPVLAHRLEEEIPNLKSPVEGFSLLSQSRYNRSGGLALLGDFFPFGR